MPVWHECVGATTARKFLVKLPSFCAESFELLTVEEVAALLPTSGHAIYAMAERAQLPGKIKIGRRLLFRRRGLIQAHRPLTTRIQLFMSATGPAAQT